MFSLVKRISSTLSKIIAFLPWRFIIIVLPILVVFAWILFSPGGLLGKADAIGYAVCHRINVRSFHIGDRQISLCARCTGQYLGTLVGLAYLSLTKPRRIGRPPWKIIVPLILFVIAFVVDGVNSYIQLIPSLAHFSIYSPSNQLRLLTGTGLGISLSVLLLTAFNQIVWKRRIPSPLIENYKEFGQLILIGFIIDLLVLIENPLILYPFSIISAGGVLLLLSMIYTMVVIMLFRLDNHYENIHQLIIPALSGFLLAMVQIFLLDIIRFMLTRTWEGFVIG